MCHGGLAGNVLNIGGSGPVDGRFVLRTSHVHWQEPCSGLSLGHTRAQSVMDMHQALQLTFIIHREKRADLMGIHHAKRL